MDRELRGKGLIRQMLILWGEKESIQQMLQDCVVLTCGDLDCSLKCLSTVMRKKKEMEHMSLDVICFEVQQSTAVAEVY